MAPTKNLLLRLDPDLAQQLQAVADIEERPVSEVVREAIRTLVDQRRADVGFQARLTASAKEQQRVLRQLRGSES
jgi:predicted transcriptional regulator